MIFLRVADLLGGGAGAAEEPFQAGMWPSSRGLSDGLHGCGTSRWWMLANTTHKRCEARTQGSGTFQPRRELPEAGRLVVSDLSNGCGLFYWLECSAALHGHLYDLQAILPVSA